MTAIHAQKTPKGIDEFKQELSVKKKIELRTWVKPLFKSEYHWVSSSADEYQFKLYNEAKKFLEKYNKTLYDAIIDASSFCEGTDLLVYEQIQEGFERNQELFLIFHLDGDWILLVQIGSKFNGMYMVEWKNENWSEWEDDPLQEQLDLLLWMLNE
jgi:hypothetical protein